MCNSTVKAVDTAVGSILKQHEDVAVEVCLIQMNLYLEFFCREDMMFVVL